MEPPPADSARARLLPGRRRGKSPDDEARAGSRASRTRSIAGIVLLVFAGLATFAILAEEMIVRQRQPLTEGTIPLAGLRAEVIVERDAFGVPRIRATSRDDAARALGFVHAQERFFQMDLLRRTAAGERAELLGATAVDSDRRNRLHQFRKRAGRVLAALTAAERATLEAYVSGVNAGLAALRLRPVEYQLLGSEPVAWKPEDSVLVGYSLFIALQNSEGDADFARGLFRRKLDPEIYSYLFENGSRWNSTMDGSVVQIHEPSSAVLRAAEVAASTTATVRPPREDRIAGSNAWAVSGSLTKSGHAMLANDLHLPLSMPGLMFRAELCYRDPRGLRRSVIGATVPGLPLVVVGSNGAVAWGLSNASVDTTDLVELDIAPGHPDSYRTPDGWQKFVDETERIAVRGGAPVILKIRHTIWGPVAPNRELSTHPLAIRWVAHEPAALNLQSIKLETAGEVSSALRSAENIGMPAMNLTLADARGNIAWTIIGYLPARVGFGGTVPVSFADGTRYWAGELDRAAIPSIVNPPGGRVWNANNWSVGRTAAIGLGDFNNGARAHHIEEMLNASSVFSEQDFLDLQHDDAALFLRRWAQLLQVTARRGQRITPERQRELLELIAGWDGHASVNSGAYAVVRDFRLNAISAMSGRLLGPVGRSPTLSLDLFDFEEPVWMLVEEASTSRHAGQFEGREKFLAEALEQTLRASDASWGSRKPLAARAWGVRNALAASHPLSTVTPALRRWLDLPHAPQAGDDHMPLVAGPKFGAALRLVVAPGAERRGLFQMPGGQSGDPSSPHYDDQFDAWLTRRGSPLLCGTIQQELRLEPVPAGEE